MKTFRSTYCRRKGARKPKAVVQLMSSFRGSDRVDESGERLTNRNQIRLDHRLPFSASAFSSKRTDFIIRSLLASVVNDLCSLCNRSIRFLEWLLLASENHEPSLLISFVQWNCHNSFLPKLQVQTDLGPEFFGQSMEVYTTQSRRDTGERINNLIELFAPIFVRL